MDHSRTARAHASPRGHGNGWTGYGRRFIVGLSLVILLRGSTVSAWLPIKTLSKSTPRLAKELLPLLADQTHVTPTTCVSGNRTVKDHAAVTHRRGFLSRSLIGLSFGTLSGLSSAVAPSRAASDISDNDRSPSSPMSRDRIASLLHSVPTFTIVDPNGVPYMVVGEDAKVTGYFFTEYAEANRILSLARTSADRAIRQEQSERRAQPRSDNDPALINPWKEARISTVPLDSAVTLVARAGSGNNYFQVAASEKDIQDALDAANKTDLAEGKVPLFYYENFTLADGDMATITSPVYFRKSELESAYRATHPKEPLPRLQVTELFSLLAELATSKDPELQTLVLVPPKESAQKAIQCKSEVPFRLGQRNIVL